MDGIRTGIVKNNWDENFPGQLKVEYTLGENGRRETGWIPVMTPYAGPGYGSYQLPEIGTEVILGFHSGDSRRPIVLGCLWNHINTLPADAADEGNTKKLWKSKGGYQLSVDEEKRIVSFTDPDGEQTMTLASQDGQLTWNMKTKVVLQMEGEDFLTIEKGLITINGEVTIKAESLTVEAEKAVVVKGESFTAEAEKDALLEAKGAMTLKPAKDLTLKGQAISLEPDDKTEIKGRSVAVKPGQGYELKTSQVKLEGMTLELKASASGKLEATGMLQVKGQMLKLN